MDDTVAAAAATVDYTLPQHQRQAAFSMLWLFVFSCCMFTMPFGAFYGVRHFMLTEYKDPTPFEVTAYSVLATILTVNVIIGVYAMVGYYETEYDNEGRVVNQSQLPVSPVFADSFYRNKSVTVSKQKKRKEQ